jgi:2-polyprenyl-3-methyl-5-hydroxy-6-metoxy-1,4-benzoquinol methylase
MAASLVWMFPPTQSLASKMANELQNAEFPEQADENRRIWDANARWWDDRIGDGNDFQLLLIEPATERLLAVRAGDTILDAACGAGRFARRMAELGARVVAFDSSAQFIARARERTPTDASIEYHVLDAANAQALLSVGSQRFNKAVCTMAIMDMPEIRPLFAALSRMLTPGGVFVFSVTHPCFHSAAIQRFAEIYEEHAGQHVVRSGVKVSSYLSPFAKKTEGIVGQPEPQWFFHRPISVLFRFGFEAGFVVDQIEEPGLPEPGTTKPGVRWSDMPDIPPIMVVRMKLMAPP